MPLSNCTRLGCWGWNSGKGGFLIPRRSVAARSRGSPVSGAFVPAAPCLAAVWPLRFARARVQHQARESLPRRRDSKRVRGGSLLLLLLVALVALASRLSGA